MCVWISIAQVMFGHFRRGDVPGISHSQPKFIPSGSFAIPFHSLWATLPPLSGSISSLLGHLKGSYKEEAMQYACIYHTTHGKLKLKDRITTIDFRYFYEPSSWRHTSASVFVGYIIAYTCTCIELKFAMYMYML